MPVDATLATPTAHPQVSLVGELIAGFLVAPQAGEGPLLVQLFQHLRQAAPAAHQRHTPLFELTVQLAQRLFKKDGVTGVEIGGLQQFVFVHKQTHHLALRGRPQQRSVVVHAQVALEPHQPHRAFQKRENRVRS